MNRINRRKYEYEINRGLSHLYLVVCESAIDKGYWNEQHWDFVVIRSNQIAGYLHVDIMKTVCDNPLPIERENVQSQQQYTKRCAA